MLSNLTSINRSPVSFPPNHFLSVYSDLVTLRRFFGLPLNVLLGGRHLIDPLYWFFILPRPLNLYLFTNLV